MMNLTCDPETWDTRLTVDDCLSRSDVVLCCDAWDSEPWFEGSLIAMPCTHELALESSALEPSAGSDLGFLMPSYSVWEWEKFHLPEIVCDELERCVEWHNFNATRLQYTVAVEVEMSVCAIRKHIFPSTEPRRRRKRVRRDGLLGAYRQTWRRARIPVPKFA